MKDKSHSNDSYYISETLRKSLGIYKLKFDYLDEVFESNGEIYKNIYINIDCILKSIYKLSKILDDNDNYAITLSAAIINLVAHYKLYFAKNNSYPKFYLFISKENDLYFLKDNIKDMDNILKVIFKYVPNVYYIRCDNSIDSSMYHFLKDNKNNLVLSRSVMDLQLLSADTDLLYLKRDESILYNKYNLFDNYLDIEHSNLDHKLFPIFLSITGVKDIANGVKKIGKKRAHKLLESYINNGIMQTHYININDFICDAEIIDPNIVSVLQRNYEIIDTINTYSQFSNSDKKKLDNYIVDKFSYNDIKELNVKYFTGEDYIMLNELMIVSGKDKNKRIVW